MPRLVAKQRNLHSRVIHRNGLAISTFVLPDNLLQLELDPDAQCTWLFCTTDSAVDPITIDISRGQPRRIEPGHVRFIPIDDVFAIVIQKIGQLGI